MSLQSISDNPVQPKVLDEQSKRKLQKAVKDFEAVFVGYLLKEMRGSQSTEGLFGESFGGDLVDSLFDLEVARQVSRTGRIGLARLLYRQLTGEDLPPPVPTGEKKPTIHEVRPRVAEQKVGAVPGRSPLQERIKPFEPIIQEAAERYGIDPHLIKAVIASESAGVPTAQSRKQAKGLMQLIDSTAAAVGVRDVWNPRENILGGSLYLKQMLERHGGDLPRALASYNAGPHAVERYGGIPPFKETQAYVERVLRYKKHFEDLEQEQP
jgi:soluble lytic murein transglycosylase-like protein